MNSLKEGGYIIHCQIDFNHLIRPILQFSTTSMHIQYKTMET